MQQLFRFLLTFYGAFSIIHMLPLSETKRGEKIWWTKEKPGERRCRSIKHVIEVIRLFVDDSPFLRWRYLRILLNFFLPSPPVQLITRLLFFPLCGIARSKNTRNRRLILLYFSKVQSNQYERSLKNAGLKQHRHEGMNEMKSLLEASHAEPLDSWIRGFVVVISLRRFFAKKREENSLNGCNYKQLAMNEAHHFQKDLHITSATCYLQYTMHESWAREERILRLLYWN